jgi:ferredoxin
MSYKASLRIWRGDAGAGALAGFQVEVSEGEVVLDVLHRLQATQASDLAVRWNCKAGKCGSCSMEINGRPRMACMTRMSVFEPDEVLTITPMRTFPVIRDLVTDVSFNYAKARQIPSTTTWARPPTSPAGAPSSPRRGCASAALSAGSSGCSCTSASSPAGATASGRCSAGGTPSPATCAVNRPRRRNRPGRRPGRALAFPDRLGASASAAVRRVGGRQHRPRPARCLPGGDRGRRQPGRFVLGYTRHGWTPVAVMVLSR